MRLPSACSSLLRCGGVSSRSWRMCVEAVRLPRRRFGSLAPPHVDVPSPSVQPPAMCHDNVVTRVGPSQWLPGLRGVFLTRPIKKFYPLEVLPAAAAGSHHPDATPAPSAHLPSAASPSSGPTTQGEPRLPPSSPTGKGASQAETAPPPLLDVVPAPPLLINLAGAPHRRISLRRFLALRHMFSSSAYLHVATEEGWYVVAPSSAAPLCADVAGLQAWCHRHHRRYLGRCAQPSPQASAETSVSTSAGVARLPRHSGMTTLESALQDGGDLTETELHALVAQERAAVIKHREDAADGDAEDDACDEVDEEAAGAGTGAVDVPHAVDFSAPPPSSRWRASSQPPLIAEAHLFQINDGVAWPLPPSEDLANQDYWKGHRQRMALYQSTGDMDMSAQREALLTALQADPQVAARMPSEKELHAAADELFACLKQKANVALHVEAETGLLTLVPLQDLAAGEELRLHYGREWWTGRFLSSLLLAVPDAEMDSIRWVEKLCSHPGDVNELFPKLIPAYAHRRWRRRRTRCGRAHNWRVAAPNVGSPASAAAAAEAAPPQTHGETSFATTSCDAATASLSSHSSSSPRRLTLAPKHCRGRPRLVLRNTVTRKEATDAAVLAFAVRRSCLDQGFFNRLVVGDAASGVAPLFCFSQPDLELPMRQLRRALLASLLGTMDAASCKVAAETSRQPSGGPIAAVSGAIAQCTADDGDIDDDDVFSV